MRRGIGLMAFSLADGCSSMSDRDSNATGWHAHGGLWEQWRCDEVLIHVVLPIKRHAIDQY